MSNSNSSTKLHPIYVALDAHQYNRAIKLAIPLPESNILGKALLAHAYSKSGQRYNALLTLQSILSFCYTNPPNNNNKKKYFWELHHEIQYSLQARQERDQKQQTQQQIQQQQQNTQQSQQQSKKGKKGKKRPNKSTANTNNSNNKAANSNNNNDNNNNNKPWDLIDQLNTPPTLPDQWEVLPTPENAIIDETILATLSVTLQSLKLPITAYQLYSWAISNNINAGETKTSKQRIDTSIMETYLTKTFCLGLNVLAYPSKYESSSSQIVLWTQVLSHLQSIALQWARLVVTTNNNDNTSSSSSTSPILLLTTAWAAQTSMWQLQWLPPNQQREMILPRLAESMAKRLIDQFQAIKNNNTNDQQEKTTKAKNPPSSALLLSSSSAEIFQLRLRTLDYQSKWSEMLDLLDPLSSAATETSGDDDTTADDEEESLQQSPSEDFFGIPLTIQQVLTEKARILTQLENYDKAQDVYETFLTLHPDDWSSWKKHLECGQLLAQKKDKEEKEDQDQDTLSSSTKRTEDFLTKTLSNTKSKYPLRGPNLMKVELTAHTIRCHTASTTTTTTSDSTDSLSSLVQAIQFYAELFAPRASCSFSDLEPYIDLLIQQLLSLGGGKEGEGGSKTTNDDDEEEKQQNEKQKQEKDDDVFDPKRLSLSTLYSLLQWSDTLRQQSCQYLQGANDFNTVLKVTKTEQKSKLRTYIFAVRLTHKLLSSLSSFDDTIHNTLKERWMPNWKDLVTEWQTSLALFREEEKKEGEETLKDIRPGDDLILLAIQQLLYQHPNRTDALVTAAVLLEAAINHSPHSAYLKIAAINVYYRLNAMSRSWEFFQAIGLKHIQLDSCTYTILPLLVSGGLYNETIELCNLLLRFQAGTARDCGEYAGRAMEAGTITKANEFLIFQREKMNKSLTLLQAKGLILDSAALLASVIWGKQNNNNNNRKVHHSHNQHHHHHHHGDTDPIFKGGLGIHQGIVGGDSDMGRATQMVVEAHNPYAALSLVSWADASSLSSKTTTTTTSVAVTSDSNSGDKNDDDYDFADNRDFSILDYQVLFQSNKPERKEKIVQDALRRGHLHGILIRATLCVDSTKGPKKGKVVKPHEELTKRTVSLLDCVKATSNFIKNNPKALILLSNEEEEEADRPSSFNHSLVQATLDLCHVLALISTGLPHETDNTTNSVIDTLEKREQRAVHVLQSQATKRLQEARQILEGGGDDDDANDDETKKKITLSVKVVCSLLPNYIVPLFALYRMCSNICTLFGWGKRKRYTKRCAGAMADFAIQFNAILKILTACLETSLPNSETSFTNSNDETTTNPVQVMEEYIELLDDNMVRETIALINQAQYRTRIRVEPILMEMKEYLDSFDVSAD